MKTYFLILSLAFALASSCSRSCPPPCPPVSSCDDPEDACCEATPFGDGNDSCHNCNCDVFGRDIWSGERFVNTGWVPKIDAAELSDTIIRFSTKMKRERRLQLEDSKAYYTDCTEKIRLVYSTQDLYEICDARDLMVDLVDGMLNALNNNPMIRADMCHQPFTADDLELYLSFESFYDQYVDPFYLGWIYMDDGLVSFYMGSVKRYYYDRWHARVEPYYKTRQFALSQRAADVIYPPAPSPYDQTVDEPLTIGLFKPSAQPKMGTKASEPTGASLPKYPLRTR